jgi:hypothetical protein
MERHLQSMVDVRKDAVRYTTAPPGGEPQLVLLALVQTGFHTVIESAPGPWITWIC